MPAKHPEASVRQEPGEAVTDLGCPQIQRPVGTDPGSAMVRLDWTGREEAARLAGSPRGGSCGGSSSSRPAQATPGAR